MESLTIQLIARLGIDLALLVLKHLQGVTTREQAIAALERVKSAQAYVDEDARQRGVPSVPLPIV